MHLFLGANQCFYKNKSDFFCNLTGKVLKIHSYNLSFLNLMLHFSTYILVRGDRDSRANLMPIYGDLYQIKL